MGKREEFKEKGYKKEVRKLENSHVYKQTETNKTRKKNRKRRKTKRKTKGSSEKRQSERNAKENEENEKVGNYHIQID